MELARTTPIPLPEPKTPITIRPAVLDDIPFMDGLQELHTKQVGWMPTKQFEGKIKAGHVLIAEERREGEGVRREEENALPSLTPHASPLTPSAVGYCIATDQYFKRDDVGIIYQMNVLPGKQRGLIGAILLKAQFERSAYGCRLYCCWCAQDIAANKFWEAMGFVPLAFRAGGVKKRREGVGVRREEEMKREGGLSLLTPHASPLTPSFSARTHIFWQKRIRSGDTTTPWWFPSQTTGGSIREDRLVLPIPPGTQWWDVKPVVLPREELVRELPVDGCQLPVKKSKKPSSLATGNSQLATRPRRQFGPPSLTIEPAPIVKTPKPKQPKRKNDPKLITAARELRDRWLEAVNAGQIAVSGGKYEITRAIDPVRGGRIEIEPMKLLPAA